MSLHGEIRVNGMVIGEWSAQRAAEQYDVHPDTEVVYDCMVRQDSTLEGNPAVLERFTLVHRFGDGALVLVAKLLEHAVENQPES